MVLKRSKFPKSLEHVSRGVVVSVNENKFQIEFSSKKGVEKLKTIEIEEYCFYEKPNLKSSVLCIYKDSKKDIITKIYGLGGKLIYNKFLD